MAYSWVHRQAIGNGHGGAGGFAAISATLPNAVQAGALLLCWWWGNSNTGNATCADNVNGSWQAATQQTPVVGSGRRANWFWFINSAPAAAGTLTVTVSPNANAGNTEFMHVMEFSSAKARDTAIDAYAAQTVSASTWNQASGTPAAANALILEGVCMDADTNNHTYAVTGGVTALSLDATGKTGGIANGGAAAIAVSYLPGSTTSGITATMTLGTSDTGGKYIIGFSPNGDPGQFFETFLPA